VTRPILAWHWTAGRRLRDGRPVRVGRWVRHEGPLVVCHSGLHASRRALDALKFAPGFWVWRVECEAIVEEEDDKLVCRARRPLWGVNARALLRVFARRCALDVAHLWPAPPAVLRYLRHGRKEDEAASWDAAGTAGAASAPWAAAWAAAGSFARAAEAARIAAGATGDAARDAQERRLVRMIHAERRKGGK